MSPEFTARYSVRMAMDTAKIVVDGVGMVSALWQAPAKSNACLVLAHGAGAGMTHKSMSAIAAGLAARGITTLRYQFPYMERGSKRPDVPRIAHATVRAAVAEAARRAPRLRQFAGGRSFGGRMTSQAQALAPLSGVQGLIFFAFPLHSAGAPSAERADHLSSIGIPMLFLQGTRDSLADLSLLRPLLAKLGTHATLKLIEEADHSFHVPAKTGRKDEEILADVLDAAALWMTRI